MSEDKCSDAETEIQPMSDSDISEEEDEVGKELTDDIEKDFYRTLCFLKKKDPKIYDKNVKFFKEGVSKDHVKGEIKKNETVSVMLRDYERNLLLEQYGNLHYDESEKKNLRSVSPTYVEEQQELRESFHNVLNESSECETDSEDKLGGLFEKCHSTKGGYVIVHEGEEDDVEYVKWLKGHKDNLHDKEIEKDLKFLHDYWNNPSLDADEKFLRDYILNKRFLEKDDPQPVDYAQLCEEERELEEQTEFEHKYNYRFEEPDREFIKRYPRIMEDSLRRKNDKRKEKREEIKSRKFQEKEKKNQELRRLKNFKKRMILAKIEELRTLTGNQQLAFEADIEDDFDANKHDRLMDEIFNEDFYTQNDPSFNKEHIEKDMWNNRKESESNQGAINVDLHCEDPHFVMDCDYSPEQTTANKKESRCQRRKNKHIKTTFNEIIGKKKPLFDPVTHKTFEAYLDEYFDIDCEDFIVDLPCRYRYSQTIPNSYGLTIEEILSADDKELDRWCSMKRVTQLQPEYKELNDLKVFEKKGQDEMLKRKILPSLYKNEFNEDSNKEIGIREDTNCAKNSSSGNKKKHKKQKSLSETNTTSITSNKCEIVCTVVNKKRKYGKGEGHAVECVTQKCESRQENKGSIQNVLGNGEICRNITSQKMQSRNRFCEGNNTNDNNKHNADHKKFKTINSKLINHNCKKLKYPHISDARLQAYGIKPKKFKNKLKYGKSS